MLPPHVAASVIHHQPISMAHDTRCLVVLVSYDSVSPVDCPNTPKWHLDGHLFPMKRQVMIDHYLPS